MIHTLNQLTERLRDMDEVGLIELLEISSDDIVDKFMDIIEDNKDHLIYKLEEDA